jgi:hypothetical protein
MLYSKECANRLATIGGCGVLLLSYCVVVRCVVVRRVCVVCLVRVFFAELLMSDLGSLITEILTPRIHKEYGGVSCRVLFQCMQFLLLYHKILNIL